MTENSRGACPKDQGVLVVQAGTLGEDICQRCQSRFLEPDITLRVFRDYLQVREELLHALSREGFQKWPCPGCGHVMNTTWVRGLEIELCAGCGGSFLDAGELYRLGQGQWEEVNVSTSSAYRARGLEAHDKRIPLDLERGFSGLAQAIRAPRGRSSVEYAGGDVSQIHVGVFCTYCDAQLELTDINWLIEDRPWCARCAAPFVSTWSRLWAPFRTVGTVCLDLLRALFDVGHERSADETVRANKADAWDALSNQNPSHWQEGADRAFLLPPAAFTAGQTPGRASDEKSRVFRRDRAWTRRWGNSHRSVDTLRVAPDDALRLFAPYFELLPRRVYRSS